MPAIVSPYLRPFLQDNTLLFDNGVLGQVQRLTPLEQEIVRALWTPTPSEQELDALAERHGIDALSQALERLIAGAILFESRSECDALFDHLLDSGLADVPFVDQVELTSNCPMRCQFCPRGVSGRMHRATGFMDIDLFAHLLDQMHPQQAQYRPLELHHLGESLLHPHVVRFVAMASHRGLPTEMSVNPALLDPNLGRQLVAAGIRRLVISLDGMDDETLTAIRGPAANYTKAERNLDALLEYSAGMLNPPRVVIQMLGLHRNRHQREIFLTRWGSINLPHVIAFVKDLDGDDPDLGVPNSHRLTYLCGYPWRSVVVLWDGRVVPCCRDADASLVLGQLGERSLKEIWDGEAAKALREAHRSANLPAGHLCDGCAWRKERFAAAMPERHPDKAVANPLQW